jgi:hypothetical protein
MQPLPLQQTLRGCGRAKPERANHDSDQTGNQKAIDAIHDAAVTGN